MWQKSIRPLRNPNPLLFKRELHIRNSLLQEAISVIAQDPVL